MRMALVILMLTAVAVTLVHLRREQTRVRHEIQQYRMESVTLRRKLWDQEVQISELTSPDRVRWRARQMPLNLVAKWELPDAEVTRRPGQ